MGQVDLHVHTNASDGYYAPRQVVEMALQLGMRVLAIADHDSTDGVAEAQEAADSTPLEIVPAVEINAEFARTELHILGYYIDCQSPWLQDMLQRLRDGRLSRAQQMVKRLARIGLPLSWERVAAIAGEGSAIGRPHVAQAMLERGYVSSVQEAFFRYIGRGGPAYVERFKLSPVEAVRLVHKVGGIPVLAHPLGIMDVVPELLPAGLAGLEAFYCGYSEEETRLVLAQAAKYRLLITGGSDFHGGGIMPETQLGSVNVPLSVVGELKRRWQEMRQ